MLRRARKLRNCITKYCKDHDYPQFDMDEVEWRQVDYLIQLTKPFFQFTMALMKTRDVTIHSVFLVYRKLLEHIDSSISRLKKKSTPWKQSMHDALLAAKQKLADYYNKTYRDHGFLYAIGTILAPQYKLSVFAEDEWSDGQNECQENYREHLKKCFRKYQQQLPDLSFNTTRYRSPQHTSELDQLLGPQSTSVLLDRGQQDEVDRYLGEGETYAYRYGRSMAD